MDRGRRGIADREDCSVPRPIAPGGCSVDPFLTVPGVAGRVRRRRRVVGHERGRPVPGVAQAAIQQGRYVGRLIARQLKGRSAEASVPLFRQGQHGRRRQELRGAGERPSSHERLPHLAGLGVRARHVASAAAEPVAGADAVVLVVFHRPAQLAIDFRAAAGASDHAGRLACRLSLIVPAAEWRRSC